MKDVPLPDDVVQALNVLANACALHNLKLLFVQVGKNRLTLDVNTPLYPNEMQYGLHTCCGYVVIKQEI